MINETFIAGTGAVYRFDPRPKFILLVSSVFFFLLESSVVLMAGGAGLILLLIALNPGLEKVLVPVKSILPILILTALLTPPFNTGGEPILMIGGKPVLTDQGLILTARLLLRFTGITAVFFLFFSTTRTDKFILALQDFGLPYKAALTVTISLRYIPYMFNTYHRIADAHKLRSAGVARAAGKNSEGGAAGAGGGRDVQKKRKGFSYRLAGLFPVLIAVLINAVKSIPALAMALDSKGFGRSNPRTQCRKLRPWIGITVQLAVCGFILAAVISASILL